MTGVLQRAQSTTALEQDPTELRAAGREVGMRAWTLAAAEARARPRAAGSPAWRGGAAVAAAEHLGGLLSAVTRSATARTAISQVLVRCAAVVEDATALRARAAALEATDWAEQSAAASARAALRAATSSGPLLPPCSWDPQSPLRRAAARLRGEADDLVADAVRRAVHDLGELRPRSADRSFLAAQVAGFGRGAWDAVQSLAPLVRLASPGSALTDPKAWRSGAGGLVSGLAGAVLQPRKAIPALLGWDQLRQGRYGEWLGGMLAGAAVPGGRAGRLDGVAARGTVRLADRGGRVLLLAGVSVPRGFPQRIQDLSPRRRTHILDGDKNGGGHRAANAGHDKSPFPADWSDDQIISRVMAAAMNPQVVQRGFHGRFLIFADQDGIILRVVVNADGSVRTGHPVASLPTHMP